LAHLAISLFGAYTVTLGGQPITTFAYDKVRALLAYLVVEKDRAHRREHLCAMLWPDAEPALAHQNLSQALYVLRGSLGRGENPYLLADRHEVRFNPNADYDLDVATFCALAATSANAPSALDGWAQAIALYQGAFMLGFSLPDALPFEEWVMLQREWLQRRALETLRHLIAGWRARGAPEAALAYAWRLVEIEPWDEQAQRHIMQLLVACGRAAAALVQYERCRDILARELNVAPQPETTALCEAIRRGIPG
jgi:DNA-binding SARP family transcriptional activator